MSIRLLKLHRPIAPPQEVWVNPEYVTHVQEAAGEDEHAEVHLRGGLVVHAVESARAIAQALRSGIQEIEEEDGGPLPTAIS